MLFIQRIVAIVFSLFFIMVVNAENFIEGTAHSVYLIRHAEKQSGKDPSLNDFGKKRASDYAQFFYDANIQNIFSTRYQRTQQTVQPLAKQHSLSIQTYNPGKLGDLAQKLIKMNANALVVGHSNTTPQLAKLLGANVVPMSEKEYNRIYQFIFKDGKLIYWTVLHGQ